MSLWLGWLGVVLLALSLAWGATRTSMIRSALHVSGVLVLGVYAVMRADYPVAMLALIALVSAVIRRRRRRQSLRRAQQVEVTFACDRFEQVRRALRPSVGTQSHGS